MPDYISAPYEIKINFERQSKNPARVFHAMSGLIETFEHFDRALIIPFGVSLDPILLLDDISTGSLRSKLAALLTSIDDEAIKELDWKKFVGSYLVKSKHFLIKKLEDKPEIQDRSQLLEITDGLNNLAQATNILHLPVYKPIPPSAVLKTIKHTTQSLSYLSPHDSAEYITHNEKVEFNTSFIYRKEMEQELLTDSSKQSTTNEKIKVKKPDYLGDSMWQFKHRGHVIFTKMEDHNWLLKFQNKQEEVKPGDALSVVLETTLNYDEQGNEVGEYYRVLKVLSVIKSSLFYDDDLLDDN